MKDQSVIIEELEKKISKCNLVLENLGNNEAFKMVLSDFEENKKRIDENWHLITDDKQLEQLRITKLAIMSLLNVLPSYEHDRRISLEEKVKLENPNVIINKDFDTE